MKHLFFGLLIACGLALFVPASDAAADSDSWSDSAGDSAGDSGKGGGSRAVPELDTTVAGSAMVLLLGGVAYIASRRRKDS